MTTDDSQNDGKIGRKSTGGKHPTSWLPLDCTRLLLLLSFLLSCPSEQLRSLFYVTECETASQEVFFFRKPVWAKFR